MVSGCPEGPPDPAQLRGRTEPWGAAGVLAIAALVVVGLWLRARGLALEGFSDDEVHKWLAANRYLSGQFGGDDVEHPMLMKSLAALSIVALRGVLAPEALTRFPNAIAGALTVWATAMLGRRLFGRAAGLLAAALLALSTTVVGYHRIGKEDVLLGLFMVLFAWCVAEAKAAADDGRSRESRRWESWAAAAVGAAFASKYFVYYVPIPLLAYAWLRPVSSWRIPPRRWPVLLALAAAVFLALDWAPLLPGTLEYIARYVRGDKIGTDRGVSESLLFMGKLYGNMAFRGDATPWWFFPAFAMVKFTPVTALLGASGVALAAWHRAPAHRILLVWAAVFLALTTLGGGKYGRFFISMMPVFLLFAAHAAVVLSRRGALVVQRVRAGTGFRMHAPRVEGLAAAWRPPSTGRGSAPAAARMAVALAAAVVLVPEAVATAAHAPHHRLYVSALGGGDARVTSFLPHCDYFDAGVREAIGWIATHAERDAEVCSEVDWTIRLYSARAGRQDLESEPIMPGSCCGGARPCYVVVQPGRIYRHNLAALERLGHAVPAHVERIRGEEAVRVYRLDPGVALFPSDATGAISAR